MSWRETTVPTLDGAPRTAARTGSELAIGEQVGRYVVLARLGQGGMGTVYAAHDPVLDRKIALKIVRPDGRGAADVADRQDALLREAQALARLAHPNVVTVHDVGTHRDRVWLAMELVHGRTLRSWLRTRRRSLDEILAVMIAAGRGVAAAHAVDLLHRDLKPDNVMVDDDDRVRVMDFGLACATSESMTSANEVDSGASSSGRQPTRVGHFAGTVAYMAPEQLRGEAIDPRTDQFSYAVTLWEALFGSRPFRGSTAIEIAASTVEGRLVSPSQRAPGWLRRIVERGLAARPDGRWPSMDALLDALQRGRARVRIRRATMGAAILCAAGLAAAGVHALDLRTRNDACLAEGARIDESWNDSMRADVIRGLTRTQVSYAEDTAAKVVPRLDRYAEAWRSARERACVTKNVRAEWDEDTLARSRWCLDDLKSQLRALTHELSQAEPSTVTNAIHAVIALPPADACIDAGRLARVQVPNATAHDEIESVRAMLSDASTLANTGRMAAALTLAQTALQAAQPLDWPPITEAARYRVALLLSRIGEYDKAEQALEHTFFSASAAGAEDVAQAAAIELVHIVGTKLGRHRDGLRWSQHAQLALEESQGSDLMLTALLLHNTGTTHFAAGSYAEARSAFERALAISEAELGSDHPGLAPRLNNLGNVHYAAASYDEAQATYRRALELFEAALGPDHPEVAIALNNVGNVHLAAGAYAEARASYVRALDIQQRALGPEHPDVAANLGNVALADLLNGDVEQAREQLRHALEIQMKALGPEHAEVGRTLMNLAHAEQSLGDLDAAATNYAHALDIAEGALGPHHPNVAATLHNLGSVHFERRAYAQAEALFERALAIWQTALGDQHPQLADPLTALAEVALATDRPGEAIAHAERASEIVAHAESHAKQLAGARFLLARALRAAAREPARSRELAVSARDAWRLIGDRERLDEVERWLRETDAPDP